MLNLLSNARDSVGARLEADKSANPVTGKITVRVVTESEKESVKIIVSDNGKSIPEDILPHIFEPFFTTKEPGKGTGLGLSISFGIITSMSGSLLARNTDEGAEFEITLPCHPRNSQSGSDEIVSEAGGLLDYSSSYRILVAEDEPMAAELLRDTLVECGFSVSTAEDGEFAFEMFLKDKPHILITDLRMPRMNGHELILNIRKIDPTFPVIVITGDLGETETLADELNSEHTVLFRKPVPLVELGYAVHNLVTDKKANVI